MIEPLYSPTQGGPFGYRCKQCARVVRTYRGAQMHCLKVHGLRAQMELFDEKATQQAANDKYVRAGSKLAERAVLITHGLLFPGGDES